jgi:hypothetical protein
VFSLLKQVFGKRHLLWPIRILEFRLLGFTPEIKVCLES